MTHLGQLPSVTVAFDIRPGLSLSQAISAINKAMLEIQAPATISGTFQGTAQAFQNSLAGMGILLVLAIFVIYLVLGMLYESFIHPVTIRSGSGFDARTSSTPRLVDKWIEHSGRVAAADAGHHPPRAAPTQLAAR